MEITVQRDIDARPDRVWEIITNIEASAEVLTGVDRVERIDGGEGFGVGTRWRETRVVFGKETTEEMTVTAVDAGRSYTAIAERGGTAYVSVLRLEALASNRSRLSMSFSATPASAATKLLGAAVGWLFTGATRRMLQRDLDDIVVHAETAPAE